jgi:hypothetical protein
MMGFYCTEELTAVGFLVGLRVGDFEGLFVGFYQKRWYKTTAAMWIRVKPMH